MFDLGQHVTRHTRTDEYVWFPAEARKTVKYQVIAQTNTFVPLAFETFGAWGEQATEFAGELGRRLTLVSGDGRETFYLRQRLSIAKQRGNAIACLDSLPHNLLTPKILP